MMTIRKRSRISIGDDSKTVRRAIAPNKALHLRGRAGAGPMDIRTLHERMGRVNYQPVRVHSFTNKRFTVNFRVPLDQLRRIVPEAIGLDEVRDTGLGVLSMCACDFWVSRL